MLEKHSFYFQKTKIIVFGKARDSTVHFLGFVESFKEVSAMTEYCAIFRCCLFSNFILSATQAEKTDKVRKTQKFPVWRICLYFNTISKNGWKYHVNECSKDSNDNKKQRWYSGWQVNVSWNWVVVEVQIGLYPGSTEPEWISFLYLRDSASKNEEIHLSTTVTS